MQTDFEQETKYCDQHIMEKGRAQQACALCRLKTRTDGYSRTQNAFFFFFVFASVKES
jgi:hypothetical protein